MAQQLRLRCRESRLQAYRHKVRLLACAVASFAMSA